MFQPKPMLDLSDWFAVSNTVMNNVNVGTEYLNNRLKVHTMYEILIKRSHI